MKFFIYLFGSLIAIALQFSCDGFTKVIDENYLDHKAKGVIFSIMTNTDERDTAFRSGTYYSTKVTEKYKNRIYITNSVPPYYAHYGGDIFYKAEVVLETNGREVPLIFMKQNNAENIRNSFFSVQEKLVPGSIYRINATDNPKVSKPHRYLNSDWSPVSAIDTMPEVIPFDLENATLKYSRDDLSPDGGYVDIVINKEIDRNHTFQIAVSAILQYSNGQENYSKLVHSYIEQPVENIDLEIFGTSRNDIIEGDDFTSEGRKRIRFSLKSRFGPYNKESTSILLVRLTTLSENYTKFLKSSDQYSANEGNPFVEPVEIYTNVENGYGIFALAARSYKEIEVK